MNCRELALKLRQEFAAKKKAGEDFGRIYLANSVTLATRVRVDIMKAMAKKFTTEREDMFVVAFASRPVLQVRSKEQNVRSMGYTFSDAVVRYGEGLQETELGDAYRRAGVAFRGQLQQNFVVLHDSQQMGAPQWARETGPMGSAAGKANMKRPREEGTQGSHPTKFWKQYKKPGVSSMAGRQGDNRKGN